MTDSPREIIAAEIHVGDCYETADRIVKALGEAAWLAENYLVWSNEHAAWWGRDRCGYTRIIANAGRYSRAEALTIAGTRGGGWHVRKGNPDEIAIPERDAIDQYADITRSQAAETPTPPVSLDDEPLMIGEH